MTQEEGQKARQLPSWIDSFLEYTDELPSPRILRLWSAIGGVAGALERRCWIETGAGPLYPNLFLLFVAPPGVGKDQALVPMRTLWASTGLLNVSPISMTHKGFVDHLASQDCKKQVVNLETNQWDQYHSLLIAVPELGVLLPQHDLGFLSTLNDLYNCYSLYEEKIRSRDGVLRIENPHIHIIAGTQPKFLGELFPEAAYGMGFTSRIIMVYASSPVRVPIFQRREKNTAEVFNKLVIDLKQIAGVKGAFKLADDVIADIEQWHMKDSVSTAPEHSRLVHYNSRRSLHIMKLMMAFSASRDNSMIITRADFNMAKSTLLDAEIYMPDIFKDISSGSNQSEMEEIFRYLMQRHQKLKQPISQKQVISFIASKVPAYQIEPLLNTMLSSGALKEVTTLKYPGAERMFEPGVLLKIE